MRERKWRTDVEEREISGESLLCAQRNWTFLQDPIGRRFFPPNGYVEKKGVAIFKFFYTFTSAPFKQNASFFFPKF